MTNHYFARVVRRRIKQSGAKRSAIADQAGVSEQAVRTWEQGTAPSIVNADALLRALGVRMVIGDPNGEDVTGQP